MDIEAVGLHAPILLAGFAGGVCNIASQPGKPSAWAALSVIIVGTLTANYVAVLMQGYIGSQTPVSFAAFVTGLGGPWICRALIRKAQTWTNGSDVK